MDYLLDDIKSIALKSNKERINYIDGRIWIPYPRAIEALSKLDDLLGRPKIERMPNLFIEGDSNNGKSEILKEFDDRFKPRIVPNEGTRLDVLMIQAPPKPDEGRLYDHILKKLNVPLNLSEKVTKKFYRTANILSELQVKMILIDEFHNIITGTFNKQREFLTVIKFLANELKLVIVAAGTKDARRVINTDDQLANRFATYELKRWSLDKEFLQLLVSFEARLPLKKKSSLAQKEIALLVFNLSEGLVGEVSQILKEAAKAAIEDGSEQITLEILEELEFTPPSSRKK